MRKLLAMYRGLRGNPWTYVPSLYFQQGLPVILVQQTSVLLYKRLGVPNDQVGLWTSLITWPWILKMLWGPVVDLNGRKRDWVLWMQMGILAALVASAFAVTTDAFLPITLAVFVVVAFLSATHDIALDGYYMLALPKDRQAFFMGIRSSFFRLAMIFANGAIVIFAGYWERSGRSIPESWRNAFLVGAIVYALLLFHARYWAPRVPQDQPARDVGGSTAPAFRAAIRSFFARPGAWTIVAFILFYRFGESMLAKMAGPFLLDARDVGGLGFDTVQVGMILGNFGVLSLVAGGLLGGILISRYGLRRCVWPMAIIMNLPNLFYVWAATVQPGAGAMILLTTVENFGYGFGMAAYMVFAMYACQESRYATSHYAIITGFMAFGAMLAGIASGYLQKALGYPGFFTAVCVATIPGMLLLRYLPMPKEESSGEVRDEVVPARSR